MDAWPTYVRYVRISAMHKRALRTHDGAAKSQSVNKATE